MFQKNTISDKTAKNLRMQPDEKKRKQNAHSHTLALRNIRRAHRHVYKGKGLLSGALCCPAVEENLISCWVAQEELISHIVLLICD